MSERAAHDLFVSYARRDNENDGYVECILDVICSAYRDKTAQDLDFADPDLDLRFAIALASDPWLPENWTAGSPTWPVRHVNTDAVCYVASLSEEAARIFETVRPGSHT